MKQENEKTLNTTEETVESVERKIAETGYPDINNVNTKTVVIGSLSVIIILFLLSVLVPIPSATDTTTEDNSTHTSKTELTM